VLQRQPLPAILTRRPADDLDVALQDGQGQTEMGEAMADRRQFGCRQQPAAVALRKRVGRLRCKLGQAQEPTPDTARRTAFEQHLLAIGERDDAAVALRQRLLHHPVG